MRFYRRFGGHEAKIPRIKISQTVWGLKMEGLRLDGGSPFSTVEIR